MISDQPGVGEQTRSGVNAATSQLRYRPNRAAQALVTGRSRAIGVVAQNSTLYGPAALLAAFEQHAAAAGLASSVCSVSAADGRSLTPAVDRLQADWSAASGYRLGLELARHSGVTAVLAANDHLALGVLRALHERGKRVPADVSVVGSDDVPEAAFFIPPLIAVRPDFAEVARWTLAALQQLMENGQAPVMREIVAPSLVRRRSVGSPR